MSDVGPENPSILETIGGILLLVGGSVAILVSAVGFVMMLIWLVDILIWTLISLHGQYSLPVLLTGLFAASMTVASVGWGLMNL